MKHKLVYTGALALVSFVALIGPGQIPRIRMNLFLPGVRTPFLSISMVDPA